MSQRQNDETIWPLYTYVGMMLKRNLRFLDVGHRHGAAVRYEQTLWENPRVT